MLGKTSAKQSGIASIVVVSVLVVVMSLVAIGFSKLMNRSLQQSSNSAISSAANFAARSAINDAIAYSKQNPKKAVTDCNTLVVNDAEFKKSANLSADTKYTCVLIDPLPADVVFQKLPPQQSQVVKLTTDVPMNGGSFMFSWESYDRSFDNLPGGQTFYNERQWSLSGYEPVMRVSLYPVGNGGALDNTANDAKTFFFYPNPKTNDQVTTVDYGSQGLQKVECGKDKSKISTGSFKGSADYNCNVIIRNLKSAEYYYARLTPIYNQTNVKVKADDNANNAVKFTSVQTVIDATAKSGNAVKRLEARVDSSGISTGRDFNISPGENGIPEFALRSSNQICKRLVAPTSTNQRAFIDINSRGICELNLKTSPPGVTLSVDRNSISNNEKVTLTWTPSNADTCTASSSPSSGGWSGNKNSSDGSHSDQSATLSGPQSYTFTITCTNSAGSVSAQQVVQVTAQPCPSGFTGTQPNCIPAPPPPPPPPGGGGGDPGGGNPGGGDPGGGSGDPGGGDPGPGGPGPISIAIWNTAGMYNGGSGVCGDNVHIWVTCPSWSASQPGGSISWCYVGWEGSRKSGFQDANDSFTLGFSNVGFPEGYLQVTCQGSSGPNVGENPKTENVYYPPLTQQVNPDPPAPPPPPPGPGGPPPPPFDPCNKFIC